MFESANHRLEGVCHNRKPSQKFKRQHRAKVAVSAAAMLACAGTAGAATIYWNGTGSTWNSVTDWSTAAAATTPNPAAVPGAGDIADFNITTVTSSQTVGLNANQSALGLVFGSSGPVTISSGTGTNVLTLGASGITVNNASGANLISANLIVTGVEKWQNLNSGVTPVAFNVSGSITRAEGGFIDFEAPGTATFTNQSTFYSSLTDQSYASLPATIIGGWAAVRTFVSGDTTDASWAVNGPNGQVTAMAAGSYTAVTNTASFNASSGKDINVTGSGTTTAPLTVDSIRFEGGNTLTNNASQASGSFIIASGGVLIGNIGATSPTFAGTGSLTSGNGSDLIFIDYSNAGNTVAISQTIIDNAGTPIGLTLNSVAGNIKMQLSGTNTFSGDTTINGSSSNDSVTLLSSLGMQNSTLNYIGGGTLYFGTTTSTGGGTPLSLTTPTILGGLKGSQNLTVQAYNTSGSSAPVAVAVPVSIGNNNQSTAYSGILTASGVFTKIGTGTLTLSGANNVTGNTNISAGTLALSGTGSLANSPIINVGPSGTFSLTGRTGGLTLGASQTISGTGIVTGSLILPSGAQISPGVNGLTTNVGTLSVANLNLASGSIINEYFGTPGVSTPGISGVIDANGSVIVPASGLKINLLDNANANGNGTIEAGVYDILNYSGGTLSGFVGGGNAAGTFTVVGTPLSGRTYTFSNTGSQIDLTIGSSVSSLTWTGFSSGSWDTTATQNWANGSSRSAYQDPNSVTFGDTSAVDGSGITNSSITVKSGGITPATVTFTANSVNYTFSNAGGDTTGISGLTGINKSGSATVNLTAPNTFSGPVMINSGIINISNGNALGNIGALSGATVASGATLQLQGNITTNAQPLSLSGTGVSSSGALVNLSGSNTYTGPVTLPAPATITSSAGALALTGGMNISNNALTINGAGNVAINTAAITGTGSVNYTGSGVLSLAGSHTYTGGTFINSGTLNIGSDSALGSVPGTAATNLTFTGNSILQAGSSGISLNAKRNITINGGVTATIDTAGNPMTINGAIGGSSAAGITKIGSGTLTLTGSNTYGGVTTISNGTLALGAAAPLAPVSGAMVQIDASRLTSGFSTVPNLGTGNGSAGSFSAGTSLPTLSTSSANQINGHQALVFNGGGNSLIGSASVYANAGSQVTMFMVEKSNSAGGYAGELSFIGPAGNTDWNVVGNMAVEDDAGGLNIRPIIGNNQNPAELNRPTTTPLVWDSTIDTGAGTGSSRLTINSSGVASTNTASGAVIAGVPFNINQMAVGGRYTGGVLGNYFSGEIGELLIYNSALTPTQTQSVESYLDNKWLGIGGGGSLPTATTLAIAGGSTFDLNGNTQQVAGLTNSGGTGGTVTNSEALSAANLTISQSGSSTFGGAIADGNGTTGITLTGGGTQILTGANTYSGNTNISAGKLVINSGGTLGATNISVANSSIFAPQPGAGSITAASLSLSNGSTFDMTDSAIGTFNVTGAGTALKIGSAVGNATNLNFDISSSGTDKIADSNAASVIGVNTITLNPLGSNLSNGTYTLISAASGLSNNFQFSNGSQTETMNIGGTIYSLSLISTATAESLAVQVPGITAVWNGSVSTAWANGSNWTSVVPGSMTTSNLDTVVFNSSPSNLSPVVDSGRNIQNITFDTSSVGAINLTGAALTLSGNGVTQTASSVQNNENIGVNLVIEGNYNFLSNSASNNTLNVSGGITGGSAGGAMLLTLGGSSTGVNTISGAISDGSATPISVAKSGASTWALGHSNTYSGDTDINGGILNIVNGALGTTGNVVFNGGVLQYASGASQDLSARIKNSTDVIAIDTNGNNVTFANTLASSNTNGLTKDGAGTLTLSASNAYVGATLINAGALNVANSSGLSSTTGVTVVSGAALQLSGNASIGAIPLTMSGTGVAAAPAGAIENIDGTNSYAGNITLTADTTIGSDAGSVTLSGNINSSGTNLTLTGNGNGTISGNITTGGGGLTQNSPGTWALTGSNTFTGGATLNAGVTQINNAAGLGATSGSANIYAATLEATATFSTTRSFGLNSATSTIQVDSGQTYTIRGQVTNGGTLNKTGPGTLVLNGTNSYSGGTNISAGTLQVGSPSSLGYNSVTLANSGTTLRLLPAPIYQAEGFNGWNLKTAGGGSAPFISGNNAVLTLTTGDSANQNRAAWQNSTVNYGSGFVASFIYTGGNSANGETFVLQNSTAGTNALGGIGGALGYTSGGQNGAVPNNNSIALGWSVGGTSTIEGGQADPTAGTTTALFDAAAATGTVALNSGDPIQFIITGTGSSNLLNYTLTDESNSHTFSGSAALTNTLSNILGNSGNALVGFTASTSGGLQTQTISNFTLTNAYSGGFNLGNNLNVNANSTIDVAYTGGSTLGSVNIGSQTLTVTNSAGGGNATLTTGGVTLNGNPTFAPAANVQLAMAGLNDNGTASTVTVAGTASSGTVNLISGSSMVAGSSIQVSSGTLLLSNAVYGSATGNAPVTVASGAFVGGTGTITSTLTVNSGGSVFVGPTNNTLNKSAGTLYIGSGSSLLGSTLLDLTAPSTSDEIIVGGGTGSVTLGGYLVVTNPNGITFAGGQNYNLFGFGSENGSFGTHVTLPTLTGSLSWNTSQLYTTGVISISGAYDVASGYEIVHGGDIVSLTAQVKSGFNNGAWNGTSGIYSSTAAADTTHLTAVGVIQNSVDGTAGGTALYNTFETQSAADTDVLVKYTYYGDANLDGKVDGSDYSRIDSSFLSESLGGPNVTGWYNGDFNYDGVVDGSDYTLIDNAFNSQGAQLSAILAGPSASVTDQIGGASGSAAVPEPTMLSLIGVGALGLLGRRRRQK